MVFERRPELALLVERAEVGKPQMIAEIAYEIGQKDVSRECDQG